MTHDDLINEKGYMLNMDSGDHLKKKKKEEEDHKYNDHSVENARERLMDTDEHDEKKEEEDHKYNDHEDMDLSEYKQEDRKIAEDDEEQDSDEEQEIFESDEENEDDPDDIVGLGEEKKNEDVIEEKKGDIEVGDLYYDQVQDIHVRETIPKPKIDNLTECDKVFLARQLAVHFDKNGYHDQHNNNKNNNSNNNI